MDPEPVDEEVTEQAGEEGRDSLILRFVGEDSDGTPIHELQAAHVAEVLEGLVGLNSDFAKAGAFGDGPPSDLLVRPAREGSFIIEVVRWVHENPEMATATIGAVGGPSLGSVIWWATKSARANVSDFEYLENGRVKVKWQDDTVDEIPTEVWDELSKRKSRRKKRLRQIMAPLSDDAVTALQVSEPDPTLDASPEEDGGPPPEFTLERTDYQLARPEDETEETHRVFETEARMSAIDFDSPDRWRVKTTNENRSATVEDAQFISRVNLGLALRKDDIFNLKIREDSVTKNGRTQRTWTVLEVKGYRKRSGDGDEA